LRSRRFRDKGVKFVEETTVIQDYL